MTRYFIIAIGLLAPTLTLAQVPDAQVNKFKPSGPPPASISFQNLVLAKVAADRSALMLLCPQYRYETRTRTVTVTKMVPETRTRVVKQKDGSDVEQTYTVQIPISEEQTQQYAVLILTEPAKFNVLVKDVRAWQINGESIDSGELLRRLSEATHVFAVEMDASQKFVAIEPYFAEVLRPGTLILYVPLGVLVSKGAPPPVAPMAAPAPPASAPPTPAPPAAVRPAPAVPAPNR